MVEHVYDSSTKKIISTSMGYIVRICFKTTKHCVCVCVCVCNFVFGVKGFGKFIPDTFLTELKQPHVKGYG